ncbi:MAG: hypothetical protein SPJ42_06115 [Oscillospiraceae bacterium]|nr:hypothetical protein [Oscillospiraceae bacterium]
MILILAVDIFINIRYVIALKSLFENNLGKIAFLSGINALRRLCYCLNSAFALCCVILGRIFGFLFLHCINLI